MRVLDSEQEGFNLGKAYEKKLTKIITVNTKPEIEILVIIHEGSYDNFTNKTPKNTKASEYCKTNCKTKGIKQSGFVKGYFTDADKLINTLKVYKQYKNKQINYSLYDLLNIVKI